MRIQYYSFKTDKATRAFSPFEIIRVAPHEFIVQCELWFIVLGMYIEKEKDRK